MDKSMMRQYAIVTYNTVEFASFVTLRLSFGVFTLAGTELPEILCSAWGDVGKKFHFHSTQRLACDD